MKTVMIAPRKYIQGRGVLGEIGSYLQLLGQKPLILWDGCVRDIVSETVRGSLDASGLEMIDVQFQGEATAGERARVTQVARDTNADISVGIGGGKVLDVAKGVAVERTRMQAEGTDARGKGRIWNHHPTVPG